MGGPTVTRAGGLAAALILVAACGGTAPASVSAPPVSSPTGTFAATATPGAAPTLAPTPPGVALRYLDNPTTGDGSSVAVAVHGTTAIGTYTSSSTPTLLVSAVWDTATGKVHALPVLPGVTNGAANGFDGTTVVGNGGTAGQPTHALAWDLGTGSVRVLDDYPGAVGNAATAVSGSTVVGQVDMGDRGFPVVWDLGTGSIRKLEEGPQGGGEVLGIDGTTAWGAVGIGEYDATLPVLWDTATGTIRRLDVPAEAASSVSVYAVVGSRAYGTWNDTATHWIAWDTATGKVVPDFTLDVPTGGDLSGTPAVDGTTAAALVAFGSRYEVVVWDLSTGAVTARFPDPGMVGPARQIVALSGRVAVGVGTPIGTPQALAWELPLP